MTIITPDSTLVGVNKINNGVAPDSKESPIPTDPAGIEKYLSVIPKPVGYRLLVRPYSGPKKTKVELS